MRGRLDIELATMDGVPIRINPFLARGTVEIVNQHLPTVYFIVDSWETAKELERRLNEYK